MKKRWGQIKNMNLICNKESDYCIVVADKAGECEMYAAEELMSFVNKSYGLQLKIINEKAFVGGNCISIGITEMFRKYWDAPEIKTLNGDGFIIREKEKNIFITGAIDRGTLFGVYGFLERYVGIRFIAADTTLIPENKSLSLPDGENYVSVPDFAMRGYPEATTFDSSVFHETVNYDFALRKRAHHSFLSPDKKHGGRSAIWGRNDSHNFHFYVRPEIYDNPKNPADYHPEFFYREGAGEVEENDVGIAVKAVTICLSNGITDDGKLDESMPISVAKIVLEELKKDVLANPDIIYFTFEQEDGNICCQCQKCKENEKRYKRSGMLIRFCNVVSTKLQEWADKELGGRPVKLVTFGYSYTSEPPVKEVDGQILPIDSTVIPCDNLVMRLAIGRSDIYSYFDERQDITTKKDLADWKNLGKHFFMWGYDAFFDRYLLFMPSVHNIAENVRGFKDYGVIYLFILGAYNSDGLWQEKMKAYVYYAMMWDVSLDQNSLIEEFLLNYFGVVGKKYVEEFITEYYEFYVDLIKKKNIYFHNFGMREKGLFPLIFLEKTLRVIADAREKTADEVSDERKKALYDKHLVQVMLNSLFPLCENYAYYYPQKSNAEYVAFAKEFVRLCNYAGVSRYHEQIRVESLIKDNYKFPY